MGSVAEATKRWRVPLVAIGVVAAVALLIAIGLLVSSEPPVPRSREAPQLAEPHIKQASWKVETSAAGAKWMADKKDWKHIRTQGRKVAGVLRHVYNALFMRPGRTPNVLRRNFLRPAAASLRRSRVGLPGSARQVQFLARRARIGIDAPYPRRAAGRVTVIVRGRAKGHRFRMRHESTLWLARGKHGWQVIAYEVLQRPQRPARGKADDKGPAKRQKDGGRRDRVASDGNRKGARGEEGRAGRKDRGRRDEDGKRRDGRSERQ